MRRRGLGRIGARRAVAAGLLAVLALSACAPEVILQGTRFPIRAPLSESQPSDANLDPQPPAAPVNQARPIALPAPVANADYPQRGGGAAHAGVSGALSTPPVLAWAVPIGHGNSRQNRVSATPVVAGGRVFTLDALDRLDAVSVAGQPLWSVDLTASFDRGGDVSGGGLAATAGAVYAATGYGEVVAVKADTGAVLWRQRLDVPAAGAPTVSGDALYVMGRDGTGWSLQLADGKVNWTVPGVDSVGGILGGAAPATDGHVVLLPLPSGSLLAVTPSGDALWSAPITGERLGRGYTLLGDITGDPVIKDGYVYVGTAAGRTAALGLADGSRLWDATEGALNPPLVAGGSVFVVSDENRLVRMDARTGETIWAADLPYYTTTKEKRRKAIYASYGPVLAGGHVVVVSSDGVLRAFNATDGSLAGTAEIPGGAASAPALAGGQLFVVSGKGQLLAFR